MKRTEVELEMSFFPFSDFSSRTFKNVAKKDVWKPGYYSRALGNENCRQSVRNMRVKTPSSLTLLTKGGRPAHS